MEKKDLKKSKKDLDLLQYLLQVVNHQRVKRKERDQKVLIHKMRKIALNQILSKIIKRMK